MIGKYRGALPNVKPGDSIILILKERRREGEKFPRLHVSSCTSVGEASLSQGNIGIPVCLESVTELSSQATPLSLPLTGEA